MEYRLHVKEENCVVNVFHRVDLSDFFFNGKQGIYNTEFVQSLELSVLKYR